MCSYGLLMFCCELLPNVAVKNRSAFVKTYKLGDRGSAVAWGLILHPRVYVCNNVRQEKRQL